MTLARDEIGPLSRAALPGEEALEARLRPSTLDEMVGQDRLRENLAVFIRAARDRGEVIDHLLFHGPPGLGKTSLAHVVANEMGASIRVTSGPAIERPGDLAAMLSNLQPDEVLFIDEVHRMSASIEEILYPAMEDFKLDIMIGQGAGAQSIRLDLPRFTLIGATTRAGLLTSPLRDRFGWSARLEYYPSEDLERIVARSSRVLGVEIEADACTEIARRSRGKPRMFSATMLCWISSVPPAIDCAGVERNEALGMSLADGDAQRKGVGAGGFHGIKRKRSHLPDAHACKAQQ